MPRLIEPVKVKDLYEGSTQMRNKVEVTRSWSSKIGMAGSS